VLEHRRTAPVTLAGRLRPHATMSRRGPRSGRRPSPGRSRSRWRRDDVLWVLGGAAVA